MSYIDIFLHLDKYMSLYMNEYGILIYLILFAAIFCETGFVITPFVPDDMIVFVTGALAVGGSIEVVPAYLIFLIAALAGDTSNYFIGRFFSKKVLARENIRFIKRENIERTEAFFHKHGGKAVLIGRLIPFMRTLTPFVAGVSNMPYRKFIRFNSLGVICWASVLFFIGYFFGNIPYVKNNFGIVIIAMIVIPLLPVIITFFKIKMAAKKR